MPEIIQQIIYLYLANAAAKKRIAKQTDVDVIRRETLLDLDVFMHKILF